jgi:hypothetical protein
MAPAESPAGAPNAERAQLASLWIGERLSPLEQASALSFLEQGHELTLYVTSEVDGVPPGVKIRDASEVLNTQSIVRHRKTGSPALHSDLFRFALLGSTDCMWVDLDIICLSPLSFASDFVFGLETPDEVNGAILKLPRSSRALQDLLEYDEQTVGYPAHLSRSRKAKYFIKSWGRGLHISEWPWGSIGPRGLTHHLKRHDEFSHALPIEAFYPIPLNDAQLFLQPERLSRAHFGRNTYAVHLWGKELRQAIRRSSEGVVHPLSFLGQEIIRQSTWSGFPIVLQLP